MIHFYYELPKEEEEPKPHQHFYETEAIYVGVRDTECVVVEILKISTLDQNGKLYSTGYHYRPHDFHGKLFYEIKTIGCITMDFTETSPGSFVERYLLPNATWRKIK